MTERAKYKNERKTKDQKIHEPQSLCRKVDHMETAEVAAWERAEQAEERLHDAIAALPEGFALYDSQDRLILCNSIYENQVFHSGNPVPYGATFEEILKDKLACGHYPEARGREANWLAERLRIHRETSGPIEQEHSNGRWYRINERRTREGATVVVSTDITEYKRAEAEVRTLNEVLEQRVAERTSEFQSVNEALRESEEQLRQLADAFPVFISYVDADQRYRFNNKAYEEAFGVSREQMYGRHIKDVLGDERYERIREGVEAALAGEHTRQEVTITFPGDDTRILEDHLVPDAAEDGRVRGVFLLATDITAHKRMEEALREASDKLELRVRERTSELRQTNEELTREVDRRVRSEEALRESKEKFQTIVNHSPTKIHIKDLEGRYLLVNKEAEKLFGVTNEDIRGRTGAEIFPKEQAEAFRAHDRAVIEADHAIEEEEEWVREDGVHTYLTVKFPIRDASGKTIAVGAIGTDITERKKMEELLRDSESRLRGVIDTVVDGVILIDATGTVQIYNQACERLFGYKANEVIGQNIKMLMPPPYGDEHDDYLRDYCETGERRIIGIGREVIGWRKDGSTMPLELSVGEVKLGNISAFVGIMREISDRKNLERQRFHAEKMEALGVFAGGIAHEFNNMLFAMIGLAESVRNALPEGNEERADLEGVLEAGERAQELVRQILAFSRQDETYPHPIDLQHTLTGAIRFVRATLPATIAIRQNLDKISKPVLIDPTHVHQIFLNLAINAADAMKENGGLLCVRLDQVIVDDRLIARLPVLASGPYARLAVRDTGCGMDVRILGRIFEPFFTTKEVNVGTGMGLAAVHGIVDRCGGAIDVTSRLGHGTTFEIYLPLWAGEEEETFPGDATRSEDLAGVGE